MTGNNARFVAPKGKLLCWKCGGDGEHEINGRDANGYPIGFIKRETCRHCGGDGLIISPIAEVKPVAVVEGWGNYGK